MSSPPFSLFAKKKKKGLGSAATTKASSGHIPAAVATPCSDLSISSSTGITRNSKAQLNSRRSRAKRVPVQKGGVVSRDGGNVKGDSDVGSAVGGATRHYCHRRLGTAGSSSDEFDGVEEVPRKRQQLEVEVDSDKPLRPRSRMSGNGSSASLSSRSSSVGMEGDSSGASLGLQSLLQELGEERRQRLEEMFFQQLDDAERGYLRHLCQLEFSPAENADDSASSRICTSSSNRSMLSASPQMSASLSPRVSPPATFLSPAFDVGDGGTREESHRPSSLPLMEEDQVLSHSIDPVFMDDDAGVSESIAPLWMRTSVAPPLTSDNHPSQTAAPSPLHLLGGGELIPGQTETLS